MTTLRKMICAICAICLLGNLFNVYAENMTIDIGEMTISNRIPILVLPHGTGIGQVGYKGEPKSGYTGPQAFAVEEEGIYILDSVNKRIIVYRNGIFDVIDISDFSEASHMKYQNGKLAISDNYNGVTGVYTTSGALLAFIQHPSEVMDEYVSEIVEIGENYVVWKTYEEKYFEYDWNIEALCECDAPLLNYSINSANATNRAIADIWNIDTENRMVALLGTRQDELVYYQYEYVPNADMFFMELSVRKVTDDGSELYAIIDTSQWHTSALEPFYFSSEGNVYLMECFEEQTVISEIVF